MKKEERLSSAPSWVHERMKFNREFHNKKSESIVDMPARPPVMGDLTPYEGPWTEAEVRHLLKRALFGVRPEDVELFVNMSMDEAVDAILTLDEAPDPPVNDYNDEDYGVIDPNVPWGSPWIYADYDNDMESGRIVSLKSWWIRQIINQNPSIHLKMHLFWHNLLVVQSWDIFYGKLSYRYWQMLHDNSLGNFREILKNITVDASMLFYLNGTYNVKDGPDENYARELQELFSLGKGPNSNYTEEDVQMAAKVLTGWRVNWPGADVTWAAYDHDESDKQFSSFFNNTVIEGKSGNGGATETDELIDMILATNESALYISRRIYQFFVYAEIDEFTEENIIQPMAELVRDNNYDLRPAVTALFKSEHFYNVLNYGAIIKNPLEFILGTLRSFHVDTESELDLKAQYDTHSSFIWTMADLGMEISDPPSVSGWPAYYQQPSYDKLWIDTTTITNRALRSDAMVYWGLWNQHEPIRLDLLGFVARLQTPHDPNLLILDASELLLGLSLSLEARDQLKEILLSGQDTDEYWTNAWFEYTGDPDDEMKRSIVETRLQTLFQVILQAPEFHLV